MQNIYKKLFGLFALATTAVVAVIYGTNTVSAEMRYTTCSVGNPGTGDFQTLCGESPELLNHLQWCSNNSGNINISLAECNSLAYLYDETVGSGWSNNGGWFANTSVNTWQGIYGPQALVVSGGHLIKLDLQNNGLAGGGIINGLDNLVYLDELNLSYNNIIGVVNAGNLSSLTKIYLDINPAINGVSMPSTTGFTSIGLSSTNIANFDPSIYPNLSILDLSDTDSTNINLSGLLNLRWVDLSNNALTGVEGLTYTHIGYYLDVSNQAGRGLTDLDISNLTDALTIDASTAGVQHLTVSSNGYGNADNFNFDYNNLCDVPGNSTGSVDTGAVLTTGNVRDFLDAYAGTTRESQQYCTVNNLRVDQYYYDAHVSWDIPISMTGSITGYTVEGANMSGADILDANTHDYTFDGTSLFTGFDYSFRVCAQYSSAVGSIYVCDNTSKTLRDPYYLLTEVTPIPSYLTTGLTGFFQFSATGNGLADPIATPCGSGAMMYVSDSSGGVYDVTIEGLQEGNTYSCSIALRSVDASGSIYSNRLPIGPFTVDTHTESPEIITPTNSSSHIRTQSMPISFVLPENNLHGSLHLSFVPQTVGQQTITLELDDANPFVVNTFSIIPAGNLLAVQEVVSGNATSIPNGTYTMTLSYQDLAGNPRASTGVYNIIIANSNGGGGGGGGGSYSSDTNVSTVTPAMWRAFYAIYNPSGTSLVTGNIFTVKAFVSDVFTLLHITKTIHRKANSDTQVVPDKLIMKVMQILQRLLVK